MVFGSVKKLDNLIVFTGKRNINVSNSDIQ